VISTEQQLRDAYQAAARTVEPGSLRGLGDLTGGRARAARWGWRRRGWLGWARSRPLAAVTAAVAVVVTGVTGGVIGPRLVSGPHHARPGHSGRPPVSHPAPQPAQHPGDGPRFFARITDNNQQVQVISATTGQPVAQVPGAAGFVEGLATADGHTFVTAWPVQPKNRCAHTRLEQFQVNDQGQPSRMTPYRIPQVPGAVGSLAVSHNWLAYLEEPGCPHDLPTGPSYVARTSLSTRHTHRWAIPSAYPAQVSLSSRTSLLETSAALGSTGISYIGVLPPTAGPGPVLQRSRILVPAAASFGINAQISAAVLAPDGKTVYYQVEQTGPAYNGRWKLEAVNVATERSRRLHTYRGFPTGLLISPSGRTLVMAADGSGPASRQEDILRYTLATGRTGRLPGQLAGDRGQDWAW
jgi:hypothetical protein